MEPVARRTRRAVRSTMAVGGSSCGSRPLRVAGSFESLTDCSEAVPDLRWSAQKQLISNGRFEGAKRARSSGPISCSSWSDFGGTMLCVHKDARNWLILRPCWWYSLCDSTEIYAPRSSPLCADFWTYAVWSSRVHRWNIASQRATTSVPCSSPSITRSSLNAAVAALNRLP